MSTNSNGKLKDLLRTVQAVLNDVASAKQLILPLLQKISSITQSRTPRRKQAILILLFSGLSTCLFLLYRLSRPPPKRLTFSSFKPADVPDLYDVIVVGAGPSGSSCAFHLARKGKKVLLLEKKAFPRDKYCGDTITHMAQEHLAEMGVLQGILDDGVAHLVDIGGFVSPCGNSFIGSSSTVMEHASPLPPVSPTAMSDLASSSSRSSSPRPPSPAPAPSSPGPSTRPPSPRPHSPSPATQAPTTTKEEYRGVITVKRTELDFRLAKAAQSAGSVLMENMNVLSAVFDSDTGIWTVECKEEPTVKHPQSPRSSNLHRSNSIISSNSLNSFSLNDSGNSNLPLHGSDPNLLNHTTSLHTSTSTLDMSTCYNKVTFRGRALVCADGAASRLARNLGIVHSEPTAVCSRSYIQSPHAFKWDGMVFYPPSLLPGCCAIVRHTGGELSYMTFINPTMGGQAKEDDLSRLHHEFIKTDPYISQALGPFIYLERMKAASVRLGGVEQGMSLNNFRTVSTSRTPTGKDRSFGDHLLVVGDAAGFVDPFTGMGIQYALEGGKIAAGVLVEGFYRRDLSMQFLQVYQERWEAAFGKNFYWSLKMGQLLCRFPILLDAMAKLIQRRGDRFLAEWTQAMTGTRSKTWFLSPAIWPFLFIEIILELFRRQFRQR